MVENTDDRPPSGKEPPHRSAKGRARARDREARLAAALRDNLKRRKAQQRRRGGTAPEGSPEPEE